VPRESVKTIFSLSCIWNHKTCRRSVFVTHYMCKIFLYKFCSKLICSD